MNTITKKLQNLPIWVWVIGLVVILAIAWNVVFGNPMYILEDFSKSANGSCQTEQYRVPATFVDNHSDTRIETVDAWKKLSNKPFNIVPACPNGV